MDGLEHSPPVVHSWAGLPGQAAGRGVSPVPTAAYAAVASSGPVAHPRHSCTSQTEVRLGSPFTPHSTSGLPELLPCASEHLPAPSPPALPLPLPQILEWPLL